MITIGSKVRVTNSNSSFWGEHGVVISEWNAGPFLIYRVALDTANPEEKLGIWEFSENDVDEARNAE